MNLINQRLLLICITVFFANSTLLGQVDITCPTWGSCNTDKNTFYLYFDGDVNMNNSVFDFEFETGLIVSPISPSASFYEDSNNRTRVEFDFSASGCPEVQHPGVVGIDGYDFTLLIDEVIECHFDESYLVEYYTYTINCAPYLSYDNNWGLISMYFDEAIHPSLLNGISFHFGPGSTYNGTYDVWETGAQGRKLYFQFPFFSDELNATLTFSDGTQCVYENGSLCPNCPPTGDPSNNDLTCIEFLDGCQEEFDKVISEYIIDDGPLGYINVWEGDCGINSNIYRLGPVGIGTNDIPNDYLLAVKGAIVTEQFKVCQEGVWCDYVFEKDYQLMSLEDVEKHIKSKGHLHKTPSAEEIKKAGGFEVDKVILDHQEKIEEIFLHLIDLNKSLNNIEENLENELNNNQ